MKSEMVDLKMLQQKVSFLISSLMLFVLSVSGTNSNFYFQCSQLNFDLSTPYELNVNSLFTSIVDSASISIFNTFEVSLPGNSQTNIIYGLFQCQGDLNSQCKDCVARSVSQLRSICPVSIGGTIQLEGCFVKYDNVSFFGVEDKTEVLKKCGPPVGSNSDVLNSIDTTLANLIAGNGQYFRKGDFGSIHGVAQCVQDLSVSDCQDCLSETSGLLRSECERSSWGDMYLGKCYIRYTGNSNGTLNSKNRNGNDLRTNIMVQAIGNAIGGVVSAIVSAVVSLSISARVAESKVKPVDKKADEAKSNAYEAKSTAVEASSAAERARLKAKKASKTSKQVRSDVNSLRSNQFVYS